MPSVAVYNQEGKKVNDMSLSDAVFAVSKNDTVVHQVYVAQLANARNSWAHAKDRSEVRGGGKKPWKQKGTGRARHGSSRSPIWTGGGVTFGPLKNRSFDKKVNKKMKQQAVRVMLSSKVRDEAWLVLEDFVTEGKTREVAKCYAALPCNGKKTLVIVDAVSEELARAAKNLKNVDVQRASDLNVVDLLHHQCVIATKGAVDVLEKRLV